MPRTPRVPSVLGGDMEGTVVPTPRVPAVLGPSVLGRGGKPSPLILSPGTRESGGVLVPAVDVGGSVATPRARGTPVGGVLPPSSNSVLPVGDVCRARVDALVGRHPCSPGAGGGVGGWPPVVAHVARGIPAKLNN